MDLRVRDCGVADLPRFISWVDSPEAMLAWSGSSNGYPLTVESLTARLEAIQGVGGRMYVVEEAGVVVGSFALGPDPQTLSASLGAVIVAPRCRERGVGRALVGGALDAAFGELGMHRVWMYVLTDNEPAIRLYRSVGFRQEGELREARRFGEEFRSVFVMAILASEWRALNDVREV